MSRLRSRSGRGHAALAVLALAGTVAVACNEESKGVPLRCTDPALPLFDSQNAGAPGDDNARYNDPGTLPCVTPVGHGISFYGPAPTAGTSNAGSSSGGTGGSGGNASGGKAGGTQNDGGAGAGG